MKALKIALACDHAGFEIKKIIVEYLINQNYDIKDFGTNSSESCDYPDFAHPLALAVESKQCDFGITICGSGNGINMAANKHQAIRSALCWKAEIAKLARQHNNANVCAIPGRYVGNNEAIEIVNVFLTTDFEGGRHIARINKIPVI